jgi:trehalose 6-phosphate synthase
MGKARRIASTQRMSSRRGAQLVEGIDHPTHLVTWTTERLDAWLRSANTREPIVVVARELSSTIEPLLRACSGVWITPEEDREEQVPHPAYRVRGVTIDGDGDGERQEHNAFADEGLWPLCHRAYIKPVFRPNDFTAYWAANAALADAACDEASGRSPLIFVHDYQYALTPQLIRERHPLARISTFWHIPWPHWQEFEVCPWSRYVLEGLLGSSIIGFQTPLDCRNFVETVERCLGAHIDRYQDAVTYAGRQVFVRVYPSSVRWPDRWASCSPPATVCGDAIRRQLQLPGEVRLGIGVDQLDYTAGLEEKLLAIERLLECYPEFRGRFVFAQLLAPHREEAPATTQLRASLRALRDRINHRYGTGGMAPIVLLEEHHAPAHVNLFLRAADLCYAGSLHEGMSLVAKEFVAARDDERGVLVLSTFAGAARELTDALTLNPYDIDDAAAVLARTLAMPDDEQRDRMQRLRAVVADFSAYRWAAQVLSDAARLRHEP